MVVLAWLSPVEESGESLCVRTLGAEGLASSDIRNLSSFSTLICLATIFSRARCWNGLDKYGNPRVFGSHGLTIPAIARNLMAKICSIMGKLPSALPLCVVDGCRFSPDTLKQSIQGGCTFSPVSFTI